MKEEGEEGEEGGFRCSCRENASKAAAAARRIGNTSFQMRRIVTTTTNILQCLDEKQS